MAVSDIASIRSRAQAVRYFARGTAFADTGRAVVARRVVLIPRKEGVCRSRRCIKGSVVARWEGAVLPGLPVAMSAGRSSNGCDVRSLVVTMRCATVLASNDG